MKTHGAKILNRFYCVQFFLDWDLFTFRSYEVIKYVNKLTFKIFKIINDELFTKILNL